MLYADFLRKKYKAMAEESDMPGMVRIPKMTLADLGLGDSDKVHPAFVVNGKEVDAVYISKYQNVVQDGIAYSIHGADPKTTVSFDKAVSVCAAKGTGWHLMTRAEWALIALWCKKNNLQPLGNNSRGKDTTETDFIAIPTAYDSNGRITRVATGTGPETWSHDGTQDGIWDLNGNVHEWVGGVRTVYGEVQILENNNAADNTKLQAENSVEWKAIDATDGTLITPDGTGTTNNSVKLDVVSNKATYSTNITTKSTTAKNVLFGNVTCDNTISEPAKQILYALALLPKDTPSSLYKGDYFSFNNGVSERMFCCGGSFSNTTGSGVFYTYVDNKRTAENVNVGFRSAYVKL